MNMGCLKNQRRMRAEKQARMDHSWVEVGPRASYWSCKTSWCQRLCNCFLHYWRDWVFIWEAFPPSSWRGVYPRVVLQFGRTLNLPRNNRLGHKHLPGTYTPAYLHVESVAKKFEHYLCQCSKTFFFITDVAECSWDAFTASSKIGVYPRVQHLYGTTLWQDSWIKR